jgi:molybdopterin-guanine dinucleotide biosynthesis protein A
LLDGKPLIEHAVAAVRPHADTIILVGREAAGWLPDRPRSGLGPLGGICAALRHAEAHRYDRVLTIGCDMPRIPAGLIEMLIARAPAYCSDAPILACWSASTAADLDRYLSTPSKAGGSTGLRLSREHEEGAKDPRLSIRGWALSIDVRPIAASAPIANVNTPTDLSLFSRSP